VSDAAAFVARASVLRGGLLVLLGIGMTALSAWIAFDPVAFRNPLLAAPTGWVGLLFFGACTSVALRQLFRRGPVLRVDARGIFWARWSEGTIPWAAVTRVEPKGMQGQLFLALWLRDPSAYPSRSLLGRAAGMNKTLGFGDIAITTQGTDRSFEDLVDAVRAQVPQLFA
jgi:hypothetical protein